MSERAPVTVAVAVMLLVLGLVATFSDEQMADLVAFLHSERGIAGSTSG